MLFRTRKLKGDGLLAGGRRFSETAISHINNKTKFFKRMAKSIDPVVDLRSERREMRGALQEMARNKKGITAQAVADRWTRWRYEKGDAFSRGEAMRLKEDFKKMGVTDTEFLKARREFHANEHREKRERGLGQNENGSVSGSGLEKFQKKDFDGSERGASHRPEHPVTFGGVLREQGSSPLSSSRVHGAFRKQAPPPMPHLPQQPKF